MSDHIPDPGQHRTLFYGEYSSRVRGTPDCDPTAATAEPQPKRRCSASWARMIAKVYHVDPLVCARCGQRMSVLAFVTDQLSIRRILGHLGRPQAAGALCSRERDSCPRLGLIATPYTRRRRSTAQTPPATLLR